MNTLKKHSFGIDAGQFVIHGDISGQALRTFGSEMDVRLRRFLPPPRAAHRVEDINYVVEIVTDPAEGVVSNNFVILRIPMGNDARIAMAMFGKQAYGKTHHLGLKPYARSPGGYALVINGFLWDSRMVNVEDIAP